MIGTKALIIPNKELQDKVDPRYRRDMETIERYINGLEAPLTSLAPVSGTGLVGTAISGAVLIGPKTGVPTNVVVTEVGQEIQIQVFGYNNFFSLGADNLVAAGTDVSVINGAIGQGTYLIVAQVTMIESDAVPGSVIVGINASNVAAGFRAGSRKSYAAGEIINMTAIANLRIGGIGGQTLQLHVHPTSGMLVKQFADDPTDVYHGTQISAYQIGA